MILLIAYSSLPAYSSLLSLRLWYCSQEALDIIQESHVALREQIARQEFSAEDVERHLAERRRVKEALKKATEAKTKARKVRGAWNICMLSVASNKKSRDNAIATFGLRFSLFLFVLQEGWTVQEEAVRHKEMLEEALEAYKTKAKALLLIPNGSQPAKVLKLSASRLSKRLRRLRFSEGSPLTFIPPACCRCCHCRMGGTSTSRYLWRGTSFMRKETFYRMTYTALSVPV